MTADPSGMRQQAFRPSGFFVVRTPLLPFDDFRSWGALDPDAALHRLAAVFRDPAIREGLYLASPTLEQQLNAWLEDPGQGAEAVRSSLVRIFSRMTGRTTPFGLFAGLTVGRIGPHSRLSLAGRADYRRDTSLDSAFLGMLLKSVAAIDEVREQLAVRPNSTLYVNAGQVRYVERRRDGELDDHYLCAVAETPPLRAAIAAAAPGVPLAALAGLLPDDGAPEQLRADYVRRLAEMQILTAALEPSVTCDDPLERPLDALASIPRAAPLCDALRETAGEMGEADRSGAGLTPAAYRRIEERLVGAAPGARVPKPFQVNMLKPAEAMTLAPPVAEEALRAIEFLHRIQPANTDPILDEFRERFAIRFEARAVPLLTALDPDNGVPFGDAMRPRPLLKGIAAGAGADGPARGWEKRDGALLRLVEAAWRERRPAIALGDGDAAALAAGNRLGLPDAFAIFFAVAAKRAEDVDRGDYSLFVRGMYGPSGAEFLGRFCAADEALRRHVSEHLRAEEAVRPDALFAEIVHLPEAQFGNVVRRPVLRDFEIPYLGVSEAADARQIPVQDLAVQIVDHSLKLFSLSRGCEVIPRLTAAHNYALRSLPVYRFLCALRSQQTVTGLEWDWGPLGAAAFLPRVTYGRAVLARARWRLDRAAQADIPAGRGKAAVRAWRRRLRMPRFVLLIEDDRELPIDLDSELCLATLLRWARQRPAMTLAEMVPDPGCLPVTGPEGGFVHEFILPFVRPPAPAAAPAEASARAVPAEPEGARSLQPADDWLYFKLYGGEKALDRLLVETLRPLVRELDEAGAISRWFFLRYLDPFHHLRLRLEGEGAALVHAVLPRVLAATGAELAAGRIRAVTIDTYEREIEKYGGPRGMSAAEGFFHADSEAVLAMLAALPANEPGDDLRWRMALAGVDRLLAECGYDLAGKLRLAARARDEFSRGFDAGASRQDLGTAFRGHRPALEALLQDPAFPPGPAGARDGAAGRAAAFEELRALERAGGLSRAVDEIVLEFCHLHINRMTVAPDPREELVLYDFLCRLYASQAARAAASRR